MARFIRILGGLARKSQGKAQGKVAEKVAENATQMRWMCVRIRRLA
jgi:hypothetical protein